MLSGFIIVHAHAKDIGRPEALGNYVGRRFAKVWPTCWIITAAFVVLLSLGIGSQPLPADPVAWLSALSLIRFSRDTPPLPVAWTLFHEVAFYAVFSVLIVHRRAGIAALGVWAVLCAGLYHDPPWPRGESGADVKSASPTPC